MCAGNEAHAPHPQECCYIDAKVREKRQHDSHSPRGGLARGLNIPYGFLYYTSSLEYRRWDFEILDIPRGWRTCVYYNVI